MRKSLEHIRPILYVSELLSIKLCDTAIISPSEAKPGDIIFFTGTYDSPGPVSHVGIYVGDGMMLHCGSPIQYANINSSYWQTHFYAFGRL